MSFEHVEHSPSDPFTAIGGRHKDTITDSKTVAAHAARASKTLARLAAAEAKAKAHATGEAEKEERRLSQRRKKAKKRDEDEAEAQMWKVAKEVAEAHKVERKVKEKAEKEHARELRRIKVEEDKVEEIHTRELRRIKVEEEKLKRKEEKKSKVYVGGLAWGYDPTAGKMVCAEQTKGIDLNSTCYGNTGHCTPSVEEEAEDVGVKLGQGRHRGNTWGVENGSPGKEGKYGYGALKDVSRRGVGQYDRIREDKRNTDATKRR